VPDGGGFAIAAGLSQVIDFIGSFRFTDESIAYLRGKKMFSDAFLAYLKNFKFTCDLYAVPEGTPVFPNEPILTVRAPLIEAQLLETMILLCMNHQSLIATKANRIVRAAAGREVFEFGSRRAHGESSAVYGARAAYIAGCTGTSCTVCDLMFGIPAKGTMAHSWVQSFESEYEAFRKYAECYPDACTLLVDTYHTFKSGLPNAIKVFNEIVVPAGYRPAGIRIDSGDIAYISRKARQILDDAGYPDCKIIASNSLDETVIRDTIIQGARVDVFGVGERLITARSEPVFGGVYKLVAVEENGRIIPKIKVSENVTKITTPCFKKLYRLYSDETGKAFADYICLRNESLDGVKTLELFDQNYTWKRTTAAGFTARELQIPIYRSGKLVYDQPDVESIRAYCAAQVDTLWDEVKRFENPHNYYVDLSQALWDIKHELLDRHSG